MILAILRRWIGFQPITFFTLSFLTLQPSTANFAFGKPPSKDTESREVVEDDETIAIFEDFDEAVKKARLTQRPLFSVFGAEWCGWCRKLEGEIAGEQGTSILKSWVLVKIDIDKQPDFAIDYGVKGVPAIRVLNLENIAIAGMDGYVPIEELKEWLNLQMSIANPKILGVLYDEEKPSPSDLEALLAFLGHRTPSIRNAASERLIRNRSQCAGVVVDTLRQGKLGEQLSAIQILKTWNAPVDGLDPWTPDSIGETSVQPLLEWLRQAPTEKDIDPDLSPKTILDAQVAESILAAVADSPSETRMAEALRYGDALLPHVSSRLASASELEDGEHETLRELNYRLLAGDKLRLEHAALLKSLASLNAETHRAAAEKLLAQLTSQDQPLLDALSNDLNPIVRELSIPKQQKSGGLNDLGRLQRLLADSSPSVRTAILRELLETPNSKSITALIAYLRDETDENLLVYATKTLGTIGAKKRGLKNDAEKALVDLSNDKSWRVRAASIDAIGQTFENQRFDGGNSSVSTTLAKAVLKATKDDDPFVVSRAEPLVIKAVTAETVDAVAKYLMNHLDKLEELTKEVSDYQKEKTFSPIVEVALKQLDSDIPLAVRDASILITRLQPEVLRSQLPSLLASDDSQTRIAAYEALIASLDALRNEEVKNDQESIPTEPIGVQPWHEVPESFQKLPADSKNRSQPDKPATQTDAPAVNFFSFLFGNAPANKKPTQQDLESVDRSSAPKDDSTAKEEGKKEDLSVVDDFFGAPPSSGPATPKTEAVGEVAGNAFDGLARPASEDDHLGLPSHWLMQWQDLNEFRQAFDWIEPVQTQIQRKIDSLDGSLDPNNVEHQWLNAVAMAIGDIERSGSVASDVRTRRDNKNGENLGPTDLSLLPWLAAEDRREWIFQEKITWENLTKENCKFLGAATEIDDPMVAEWILKAIDSEQASAEQISSILPYLKRALFGSKADALGGYIYEATSEFQLSNSETVPGRMRAEAWLRAKYESASTEPLRSLLLSVLSYVDHECAAQSSVGFIAKATQSSPLLDVALRIALLDRIDASVDRAVQWLEHPLPKVRNQALHRLCSMASKYREAFENNFQPVIVLQFHEELPGVWYARRSLPRKPLEELSQEDSDEGRLASILLLALPADAPFPAEIDRSIPIEANELLICTALSLAERVDPAAIAVYRQAAEKRNEHQEAKAYYSLMKDLPGADVRAIRTDLRKNFQTNMADPFQ